MAWLSLTLIAGLALLEAVMAAGVIVMLRRRPAVQPGQNHAPPATVIICLRGADPYLKACLQAALEQDYADYGVLVVIDRNDDPAWDIVRPLLSAPGGRRLRAVTLSAPSPTCSLKCSSLVQALSELDKRCEVVALLDADCVPHATWLRELVAPLADAGVAVTTGNRWYMPPDSRPGSLVRYIWNAGAVVHMLWCGIAWGGTLALKRSFIEKAALADLWSQAFCEDTMLAHVVRRHALRQMFVPSLLMVNRESCTLANLLPWITRQLLTARLYHAGWRITLAYGGGAALIILLSIMAAAAGCWQREPTAALIPLGGLFAWGIVRIAVLASIESAARRIVKQRGEATHWLAWQSCLLFPAILTLTQALYPWTLLRAQVLRLVNWRGVSYRVAGPWKIERLDHPPYSGESIGNGQSL